EKLTTDQPYEWEVRSTDVVWICEMGSESTHGEFSAFVDRIVSARVDGDIDHVTFESPSLGGVSTGWNRGLFVAGKDIPVKDYPRFANPYCQAVFGAEAFHICAGNEMLRLKINPDDP
ncbi:MAG: hypothetical protein WCO94_01990, partial [Verrucomicrobiota bacterium]